MAHHGTPWQLPWQPMVLHGSFHGLCMGHGSWEAMAMVMGTCHGMPWLSVTCSRGHATDAPWPRLGEHAMVARGNTMGEQG